MRRSSIYLAALLLLGCESQMPQRNVALSQSHFLKLRDLILDDGRDIPVLPPVVWDANARVFREWAQIGNVAELRYKDDQGREIVGEFEGIYQGKDTTQLYAILLRTIRYRADGTKEIATDYDGRGSPSSWSCYASDGQRETVRIKQYVGEDGTPRLQWVAVPDKQGRMQTYGLKSGEADDESLLHLEPVDINQPLQ